jgi:signal transduction histidine kinase
MLGMTSPTETHRQLFQRLPLDPELPVPSVVLTGEPILIGSAADFRQRYPKAYARVSPALSLTDLAFAIYPLIATDEPIGAISFAYDHARQFDASERAFKAIIARQCALALVRIRLFDDEHRHREAAEASAVAERTARTQSEHLYKLATAIERTTEVGEVCELALETTEQVVRCDRVAILLVDPDGVMRFKAHHGLSATYRAAVDGHSPWSLDARDPEPVQVADTETDRAWAGYREIFRAEGIRALAFVPLVDQHRVIGKIMVYRSAPEPFTADELQRISAIAVQVALPIVRRNAEHALAIALAEERAAHQEAEAATRAREEILSVVSHDLRNPLGTILTGATSLLHVNVGTSERHQRSRLIAERIHRQAGRMARLIEDLVDFASIQAGRVVLEVGSHAPQEILEATSDMFTPLAVENGLHLETRMPSGLPSIDCDSQRAIQVMSNLVTNALKVTPRGGAIAIGAEPSERAVVFYVRDTGPGIEPEDLPKLFERFWRSKSTTYRGAGLGLSIARGIVDAHGGRIWAESKVGAGSTFYFSLSSVRN